MDVLRWGWSSYETEADLDLERRAAQALGLGWRVRAETSHPDLDGVGALVVTSGVVVDRAVLERFEGTLVLTTTSGHDHIDLAMARQRGVQVGRCPMARRDAVVEHALGAMIGLMRDWPALHTAARADSWARAALPELASVGLRRARVIVIGAGVIGRRMLEVLDVLGADVVGVDPAGVPPSFRGAELDQVIGGADAITVHCSLSSTSDGLLSRERLARCREGAVVVNTARGRVLDVDAAVEAVVAGRLRGVAVDVFPEEPYRHLAASAAVPGVWLSPHAAGFTRDLGAKVAQGVADGLAAWVGGISQPFPVA